jgi:hypothetical protein
VHATTVCFPHPCPLLPLIAFLSCNPTFRLWHQLTLKLEEFVKSFAGTTNHAEVVGLYDSFIKRFETKVNKLKLSVINVQIANQCESTLLFSPSSRVHMGLADLFASH